MPSFDLTRGRALHIAASAAAMSLVPAMLTPAGAAVDSYLTFDDPALKGTGPNNGIEVTSFSFGGSQNPSSAAYGTGAGAGKVALTTSTFTITKRADAASPGLSAACASGKHFPTMTLTANGRTYTFEDVVIATDVKGPAGTDATETLTFRYAALAGAATPKPLEPNLHPIMVPTKKPS